MRGYVFASGDLISNPNTYFYTPYEGVNFFNDWKDSRKHAVSENIAPQPPIESGVALPLEVLQERLCQGTVGASHVLDSLYEWISNKNEGDESGVNLINQLVKGFEVTKRIYGSYCGQLRPLDKEKFNEPVLYVRVAEVFEAAYNLFGTIQYLNVLIKVIDTLCAISNKLNTVEQARLRLLIIKEKKHIDSLATSVGVIL